VLPEIALHWHIDDSPIDLGVATVSPETAPFADLAKRHGLHLLLGMYERDGDAVFNSAVLYGPDGDVAGVYRKVHLAVGGEDENGLLAGDDFPVFDTDIGRIGCNICMDSSAAESSRMVGLNGADFLLLPIMGDHRADRWTMGSPHFSEERWKAIMRTHAMDTQLCMVVVRNETHGSCVVDRKGDILAWNEGDRDFVIATVELDDGYRTWAGGCFRDVNWMQRRPHLYSESTRPENVGGMTQATILPGRRDMSR
jgi:predicted amidohydrolase